MKRLVLVFSAVAGVITSAPAMADRHYDDRDHGRHSSHSRTYDEHGRYYQPRRVTRDSHIWRGDDGRYHCRRDNGTTGLLIGAGVGALAGNELAGPGDKTLGVILGAAVGGALGRAIDRGDLQCR